MNTRRYRATWKEITNRPTIHLRYAGRKTHSQWNEAAETDSKVFRQVTKRCGGTKNALWWGGFPACPSLWHYCQMHSHRVYCLLPRRPLLQVILSERMTHGTQTYGEFICHMSTIQRTKDFCDLIVVYICLSSTAEVRDRWQNNDSPNQTAFFYSIYQSITKLP